MSALWTDQFGAGFVDGVITFENVVGARLIVTDTESLSSFWLCEVRHFPGLANSRGAIWSVIFQALQFPGLRFGPSFSRACIFQSLFFCGPSFSGPANSAPPSKPLPKT